MLRVLCWSLMTLDLHISRSTVATAVSFLSRQGLIARLDLERG